MHGHGFVRPQAAKLDLCDLGSSHRTDLVLSKYRHDRPYALKTVIDPLLNYSVLIDNGIDNKDQSFVKQFPNSKIIKICYSDHTWPIVAHAMIVKAMNSTVENELVPDKSAWSSADDWAQREKYFLFLKEHHYRMAWKLQHGVSPVWIDQMLDYTDLEQQLELAGIKINNFNHDWQDWRQANSKYINPVTDSMLVIKNVKNQVDQDLSHITDVWTQSVIYYHLWLEFGHEVPHNDYKDFFQDTSQIYQWLKTQ